MVVLVFLSVGIGYGFSIVLMFFFDGLNFYEVLVVLLIFVLFGYWFEMWVCVGVLDVMKVLLKLFLFCVVVWCEGQEFDIFIVEVLVGEIVIVWFGVKILVDGIVMEGSFQVDEFMLIGELMLVCKDFGEFVVGGLINKSGVFVYIVIKIGSDMVLVQIIKLVQIVQNFKVFVQLFVDCVL